MKKIIATFVVLTLFCSTFFMGCSTLKDKEPTNISHRFTVVASETGGIFDEWLKAHTCADKETGVVYFVIVGDRTMAMTPLLNTDGTPMTYDFKQRQIIKKEGNTK